MAVQWVDWTVEQWADYLAAHLAETMVVYWVGRSAAVRAASLVETTAEMTAEMTAA